MNAAAVSVQLYGGGLCDGRTLTIPADLHRTGVLRVPVPPPSPVFNPDDDGPSLGPEPLVFRWDGTLSNVGHARYRCAS